MRTNSMKFRSLAIGCALLGAATAAQAQAQDVDGKLAAYKAASTEATALMTRVTDAASAKANEAALEAAMAKQRAAEAALNAETKKLKLTDKKDADKLEAVVAEQRKTNEALSAQQMRILTNKDAGEVVGKSFMAK